jgi:hypothetical protein
MWRGDPDSVTLPAPMPSIIAAPRPLHPTPMVTPLATPLSTPRPAAWAPLPLPPAALPSLSAIGGPLVPGTMPPPMSSVRLAAPTPNEIIEGERDRQGSISLLRRRAFEESARQQKDRESAIHHELQAAQAELSSLRNKLTDEQARAQVIAGTLNLLQCQPRPPRLSDLYCRYPPVPHHAAYPLPYPPTHQPTHPPPAAPRSHTVPSRACRRSSRPFVPSSALSSSSLRCARHAARPRSWSCSRLWSARARRRARPRRMLRRRRAC